MAASALMAQNGLSEESADEQRCSNRDSVGDTRSSSCGSCEDHTMDAVSCGSDASDCLQPITMETNPIFQHSPDSGTFGSLRDAELQLAPSELQELHQRHKDALLQHEINMNLNHGMQCVDVGHMGHNDMDDLEENDNLVSVHRIHLDDKLNEQIGNGISNVDLLKACKLDFQQKLDPHSLSLPVPIQNSERKKRHCSVEDPSLDMLSSADSDLSRSLPHGTIVQKGDMIEFIADNLVEKIKRSSSLSMADSSSLHTRTSSVQSFGSISSTNSAYSASRTSSYCGVSQSTSSLVPQSPDDIPPIDPHALMDLETQAKQVADRLDHMMASLRSNLHKMSALTSGCLDAYKKSVDSTCDAVDGSIKSMYALMAKCEELGKSMMPIYQLADQIKEIKRLLDIFENKLVDRS